VARSLAHAERSPLESNTTTDRGRGFDFIVHCLKAHQHYELTVGAVGDDRLGEVAVLVLGDLGAHPYRVVRVRFQTRDLPGRVRPDGDDLPLVDVFLRIHVVIDVVPEYPGVGRRIPRHLEGRRRDAS